MRSAMKYVVDTNIFNKLVDGVIKPEELPDDGEFVATHIQMDELRHTKNEERRQSLLVKFDELIDEIVPTESFVLGTSRLGQGKLGGGASFDGIKADLDSKNKGKANNSNDALIAEVAAKNGYTLLTADSDLYEVVQEHDIAYHFWATSRDQSGDDGRSGR